MASRDELEPGQDDLVKEDKASTAIKRALKGAKNAAPGRTGDDERLYADPAASNPVVTGASGEPQKKLRRLSSQRDDVPQPKQKKQGLFSGLKEMWAQAIADAEQRQKSKRQKK